MPDYPVHLAAVELGCSDQLIRYYCRRLDVGTRVGRAPRGVWMLSASDLDTIAEHRSRRGEPVNRFAARAQDDRPKLADKPISAAWSTTAEVAQLLGVTERAVRARAAVRGVGSRAHARLATYSAADVAELRRAVPRGRPAGSTAAVPAA